MPTDPLLLPPGGPPMIHPLYTFGYARGSHMDLEGFIDLGCRIVDIRFAPWSKHPIWQKAYLDARFGSSYLHLRDLGNRLYRTGEIDIHRPEAGLTRLGELLADTPCVLMCACPQLYECHRLVVSRLAADRFPGLLVEHLEPGRRILVGAGRAP